MTKAEKLKLEFYKNGSAQSVLNRFVFNEKEEKLVQDAVRTAHLANPRMKLIYEADELLREVAKTREPIAPAEKTEVSAEVMAKLELLRLTTTKKQAEANFDNKMPSFFGFKSKHGIMLVVLMAISLIAVQFFSAKQVTERSSQQAESYHDEAMKFTGRPIKH